MINKVIIENFQSHKHTVVEFVPGTNVIIGESDTGKSAIFRAINWVCSNRPLGDAFLSEWGGDTKVVLYTSEGNVIERLKTKYRNEYIINGEVLEAFGKDVPDEVLNILQMDFANIQAQMDTPFLLSYTSGEAAKLLNKAASIDDIDSTMEKLRWSYKKIGGKIKTDEAMLKVYKEEIKEYSNIPLLEKKLNIIESSYSIYEEQQERYAQISYVLSNIKTAQKDLKKTEYVEKGILFFKNIDKSFQRYNERKEEARKVKALTLLIIEKQLKIERLRNVNTQISHVNSLEKKVNTLKEEKKKKAEIERIITQISKAKRMIDDLEISIKMREKQYKNLTPEICPLCGNLMSSKN